MKRQVITRFGDTSIFETQEISMPALTPGHVLVKVVATSVNPLDTKIRAGLLQGVTPDFPAVLHADVAGIIEKKAADVSQFEVGDAVFGCAGGVKGTDGALSEYMLVDAKLIAKKPASLSMAEAAALPLVSITAWEALFEKIQIVPGQTILIHAGTGGVGHIAIQLAKWAGATVYTTVSTPEKAAIATALGAVEAINYRQESVQDYVNRLTHGKGFDVVLDTVGGDNINASLQAVAQYGKVITILSSSSHDLTPLFLKSASLHAVFMLVPMLYNVERERHGEIIKRIAELADKGVLKPLIDAKRFSFAEVGNAHALLESGKAIGKIVISHT